MMRVWLSVLAAIVVLTVAWYFAFWSPASEQQVALETETATLEAQQAQLRTQLGQLNDIREREVQIRADLTRVEQFIPTNPSQASLIRQSQLAANASAVEILSLAFAEPVVVEGAPLPAQPGLVLGSIAATGQIEGGYFQIVDFFRRLEVEVTRAILVETITVEEGEGGFPRLSATFTADLFALITAPVDPNAPVVPATPAPTEGATPAPTEGEAVSMAPEGPMEVMTR